MQAKELRILFKISQQALHTHKILKKEDTILDSKKGKREENT